MVIISFVILYVCDSNLTSPSFFLIIYLSKKMVSIMDTYESDDNHNILLRKLWKSCVISNFNLFLFFICNLYFWVMQSNKSKQCIPTTKWQWPNIYSGLMRVNNVRPQPSGPILNSGHVESKQCTPTTNWPNLKYWASR